MTEAIILIHGLGRTPRSMRPLSLYLNKAGFATQLFGYDSRRSNMAQIVAQLHATIERLRPHHSQIHFVTHSLGGIVLRAYIAQHGTINGRAVMLAPPHHGSEIIDFWRGGAIRHAFFKQLMGDLALTLHTDANSLPNQLPTLAQHNIGIIAGTRSVEYWFNRLFQTPHDGKVSVDSTRLHTNHAHKTVDATHTFIMNHAKTRINCLNFLKNGQFVADAS